MHTHACDPGEDVPMPVEDLPAVRAFTMDAATLPELQCPPLSRRKKYRFVVERGYAVHDLSLLTQLRQMSPRAPAGTDEKGAAAVDVEMKNHEAYLQSHRYFLAPRPSGASRLGGDGGSLSLPPSLLPLFTFRPAVKAAAATYVRGIAWQDDDGTGGPHASGRTLVGVHVRRGDHVTRQGLEYLAFPPAAYFTEAMAFHRDAAAKAGRPRVSFLVVSDDPAWCARQAFFRDDPAVYVKGAKAGDSDHSSPGSHHTRSEEDMAILAQCDGVITTLGTFGWWAALLSGGKGPVTYYAEQFRLEHRVNRGRVRTGDYFPPHWIGISPGGGPGRKSS